jgi:Holliday junction resolvasome RuvABC endonuclease subunit
LGLAAGAIWASAQDFDLFWHWADVAAWKKAVVGNGNAKKTEVEAWSLMHGGEPHWEEDHHDANAISQHGMLLLASL